MGNSMKSQSIRKSLSISLAALLFTGMSCATPKTGTPSETQTSEHEGHHPTISETQKLNDDPKMKDNGGMMAGENMGSGMMMDKMKMKKMMDQCMIDRKDNKMCDHQMMDTCSKNMDTQKCMNMMSDAKKEGNAIKGKRH